MGSKFAACVWIYTKEVLTRGQIPTPEKEEYLKRRMLSIMLCMNWVCAGIFDNHEWFSESTLSEQEAEVMGMELSDEIDIPCVAGQDLTQNTEFGMNKEMDGWETRGSPER